MKFGVMMHKHTQNIGDDIQTFAAARLLPELVLVRQLSAEHSECGDV